MIEEIRKLISEDQVDDAIDLIAKSGSINDENQILILKNQWKGLKNMYIIGTVTGEEYLTRKTKFLESLLWLINPNSLSIGTIIKELEDLRSENLQLKKEVAFYRDKEDNYNGYRFEELYQLLNQRKLKFGDISFLGYYFENKMENILRERYLGTDYTIDDKESEEEYRRIKWGWEFTQNHFIYFMRNEISIWGDVESPRMHHGESVQILLKESLDCGVLSIDGIPGDDRGHAIFNFTDTGKRYLIELIRRKSSQLNKIK